MRLFELPPPRVGRPVRHPFRLPVRLRHRLLRGIPATVLSRRRSLEGELGLLPLVEALKARANVIAEEVRRRLLDLCDGLQRFHSGDRWSQRP